MSFKHILWDNDGVLVDTEELFFEATRRILAGVGVTVSREMFVEHSMTRGTSLFDLADGQDVERLRANRDDLYGGMLSERSHAMPGAEEVLSALHGKVGMGVVTSSRRGHFETMHARTGFQKYFDFVLTREDFGETKPSPEPYLTAIRRHAIDPAEAIVVEDSIRGLQSALAAGLRCIVVPNDLTRGSDFAGATTICGSLSELPALLDRLGR